MGPEALAEVLPYYEQQGVGLVPYSPLGSGFLTGRFSPFDELPADARRQWDRFQQEALQQTSLSSAEFVPLPNDSKPASPGSARLDHSEYLLLVLTRQNAAALALSIWAGSAR